MDQKYILLQDINGYEWKRVNGFPIPPTDDVELKKFKRNVFYFNQTAADWLHDNDIKFDVVARAFIVSERGNHFGWKSVEWQRSPRTYEPKPNEDRVRFPEGLGYLLIGCRDSSWF